MRLFAFYLGQPYNDDVPPSEIYDNILDEAVLAENLGYDGIWLAEHHFVSNFSIIPNPLTLCAAISQRTRRLRIGTAVLTLPLHQPVRVAEEICMVDQLSKGRAEVCLGRGTWIPEYEGLSVPFSETQLRMREALDIVLQTLKGHDVGYEGKVWSFPPSTVVPRPVQVPHPPLWVAATSGKTLGMALDRSLHVVLNAGVTGRERVIEFRQTFLDECEKRGIDPSMQRFGVQMWAHYAPDDEAIDKGVEAVDHVMQIGSRMWVDVAQQFINRGLFSLSGHTDVAKEAIEAANVMDWEGTMDQIVAGNLIGDIDHLSAQLDFIRELGATDLIVMFDSGGITPDERRRTMQTVASLAGLSAEPIPAASG